MGGKFESILGTVGDTPVVRINRLGPKGINLFVKIEAFNPLGSVKDRLALGAKLLGLSVTVDADVDLGCALLCSLAIRHLLQH